MTPANASVKTGWARVDIPPDQSVILAGQFHARVSEGVMDPVTATALAIESVDDGGSRGQVVMVSCDLATVSNELRDAVRARVRSRLSALDPCSVFLGATHTHSAPDARLRPYVEEALEEALPFKDEFGQLMDEIERNPEIRKKSRWYTEVTRAYRRMERGERVRKRLELQKRDPDLTVETHVIRIGDMAFATSPFELYLDYAVRIRERSKATQTFLIQKAGCSGTYLPSDRSVSHKGYGSVPASTNVGPDGGDKLVDWTVNAINEMWSVPERTQP